MALLALTFHHEFITQACVCLQHLLLLELFPCEQSVSLDFWLWNQNNLVPMCKALPIQGFTKASEHEGIPVLAILNKPEAGVWTSSAQRPIIVFFEQRLYKLWVLPPYWIASGWLIGAQFSCYFQGNANARREMKMSFLTLTLQRKCLGYIIDNWIPSVHVWERYHILHWNFNENSRILFSGGPKSRHHLKNY